MLVLFISILQLALHLLSSERMAELSDTFYLRYFDLRRKNCYNYDVALCLRVFANGIVSLEWMN